MARYRVQGPDGKVYVFEGPAGASAAEVEAFAERMITERERLRAEDAKRYSPAAQDDGSLIGYLDAVRQNAPAAIGGGLASALRAVGASSMLRALGLPDTKAEADRLDAPLNDAPGGTVGRVVGHAAPALLALPFTPATLPGAAIAGAATGAAFTEGGASDRLDAALGGAAGGALGTLAGRGISAAATRLQAIQAARRAAQAARAPAIDAAQGAGYVLPPNEIKRDATNALLNAWAGPVKTRQAASLRNQANTNRLAAEAVGLPTDQPLTAEALRGVRAAAGKAYDRVRDAGAVAADDLYRADLAAITSANQNAARAFPGLAKSPIDDVVASLDRPQFDASSAVDAMRLLRSHADGAFAKGDKSLGAAYRSASDALENMVDRHLAAGGSPEALGAFRDARALMAKTYDVERALNPATGDVSAARIAARAARGRPMSDQLGQIAQAHRSFPLALQTLKEAPAPYSALDVLMGGGSSLATGNPAMALVSAARPAVRSATLTNWGQRFAGADVMPSQLDLLGGGIRSIDNRAARDALSVLLMSQGAEQAAQ